MAGDVNVPEKVIVLPPTAQTLTAPSVEALEQRGGAVLHQFGPRVLIARLEDEQQAAVEEALPAGSLARTVDDVKAEDLQDLDDTGRLGAEALTLRLRWR